MSSYQKSGSLIAAFLLIAAVQGTARAEFVMDWAADSATPAFSGTTDIHGGAALANQTPFIYERSFDGTTPYYHMVVGDPSQGFSQEVYVQVGGSCGGCQSFGPAGGLIGANGSASGGNTGSGTPANGSGTDPLEVITDSAFSGNASGNPQRVQMQQIMEDGELSVTFTKDKFAEKPTISNDLNTTDMSAHVTIDSTGNTYTSADTLSTVTNTVQITDPDIPAGSATYDMANFDMGVAPQDSQQNSHVTAGQYTYTAGSGNQGSGGTYTYSEGSANTSPDWSSFFDDRETNPWAYPVNRP